MKTKHINLLKKLGYLAAVVSAGVICAVSVADHIETYYTPKFDADQLARDKAQLEISTQAREIERGAVYEECYARVMNTQYIQELNHKLDSMADILATPEDVFYDLYPSGSIYGTIFEMNLVMGKMEQAVENAVNETPKIRELDKQIASYNNKIAALEADRAKCAEWKQMSKKERIKQNWHRMCHQNDDILIAASYNNAKSY